MRAVRKCLLRPAADRDGSVCMIEQTWRDISVPFLFGRTLYGIEIDTVSVSISMGSGAHGGSFMSLEAQHKLLWSDFFAFCGPYLWSRCVSKRQTLIYERKIMAESSRRREHESTVHVANLCRVGTRLHFNIFNDLECFGIPHPYIFRGTIPFGSVALF